MKKALYGSTALVAAGLLASGAVAAERIKVGIEGYFQAFFVHTDEDDGAGEPAVNRRSHAIKREAEIEFYGKTTLDNGIEVGVKVQLEAETCADQIDQSYVWFEGGFGQIRLGNHYGASYEMFYGSPTPIVGHGVNTPNFLHLQVGGNAILTPVSYVTATFKSEKATYFTPRIAGFQFGLSYTPDACEEANPGGGGSGTGFGCGGSYSGVQLDNNQGQQSEAFEIGLNWVGSFMGAEIGVYGGYAGAELEADATGTLEDLDVWGLGGNVGYAGFVVGASYRHSDQGLRGGNSDRTDWNVGLSYSWGDWTLGAMYGKTVAEAGVGAGESELEGLEIGAQYALGPGVVLTGGVQFWDLEDNAGLAANENDAVILIFGTSVSF